MKHRNVLAVTATLAGIALAVTGCSGGSGGSGGSGSDDSGKKTLPTSAQINPKPVSDLEDGGTLRLPISQWVSQWNYNQVDGPLVDAATIEQATMPYVYTIDGKGAPTLDTDYVSKAEVTSDDPLTISYTINDKAKWNDGSEITWRDFENEWKTTNGTDKAYLIAGSTGYEDISSVTKGATDKDVVVKFSTPFSDWKSLFSPLYPASQTSTPDQFNNGYKGKVPVSSGPYKITDLNETAGTVTMKPDENWWGDKPKLDQVIFRSLDGNADVDAYLNKEIDSVLTTTSERFDRVKNAKNTKILASTSAQYTHVDFSTNGLLKDKQLRLAIQHAVNRDALAQVIGGTLPYKLGTLDNHLFLSTDKGYKSNTKPNGDFDVEKAKKLLDDDGWKTDGTYRTKGGKQLAIAITIQSGAPVSQQLAQVMQQQLKEIGVKLTLKSVATDDFFEQYVTPGNYDMTIFVWGGTGFHSSAATIYTSGATGQNYGRVSSSAIDTLTKQALSEPDSDKANVIWNKIDKQVWSIGHSMPITAKPALVAQNPKLANYGAFAGAQNIDWTKVGFTK